MEHGELEEKRRRAGDDILALREVIPSTMLLDQLGKAYKRGSWGYWISIVLFLNVIILGPWLLIGLSRKELEWTRYLWVSGSMAVEFVIAGFILAHLETCRVLEDIPALIIPRLLDGCELPALGDWLRNSLSIRGMAPFVLCVWLVWVAVGVAGQSLVHRQFVGLGFSLTVLLEGLLAALALYSVFWISRLAYQLRRYRYELNWFSPVSSQVLRNITALIKKRAYAFSLYFAAFMLTSSTSLVDRNSKLVFVLPAFLIIWTIMIAQYLITRSTTASIVDREKWKTLNTLAGKINQIDPAGDLAEKDTAERLLRLGEIHRQVLASKTSTFDLNSIATLLGQLMLPILGLLLGNLDKVSGLLH